MESIIHAVTEWVTGIISAMGYYGIILLMGIESACIPVPSEVIMPYGGYLVYSEPQRFSVWGMGVAGALGCVWGSILAYWAGMYGGRPFAEKYGKYFLVRHKDLDRADQWFARHGVTAVFIGRLLPVIRTFISFPAGMARVNFVQFVAYTFLGSLPWCLALAYAGKALGAKWDQELKKYFHGADVIIGVAILILVGLYVYHHIKSDKEYVEEKARASERDEVLEGAERVD